MTAALVAAVFVGALFQSVVGFGSMLVAAPVLFMILEPEQAVLCALGLGLLLNALVVLRDRRPPPGDVWWAIGCSLPTMALGVLVVTTVPGPALLAVAGAVSLALGVHRLASPAVIAPEMGAEGTPATAWPAQRRRRGGVLAGAASGLLNTSVGINGPPLAYWLARSHPDDFRYHFALVSLAQSIVGLALLAPNVARADLDSTLRLAPALLLAVVAAFAVSRFIRLPDARHARVVALVIVATGVTALVRAALSVAGWA